MWEELDELLRAAIDDAAYGVNAKLADLPQGGGSAPKIKAARSAFSDEAIANGAVGDDWPLIVVGPTRPLRLRNDLGQRHRRDTVAVPIGFAYVSRDPDVAQAMRHGSRTLRALTQTIWALMGQDVNGTARNLRSVCLVGWGDEEAMLTPLNLETEDQAKVTGSLVAPFRVRDALI